MKILIIKPSSLGDIINTVPLVSDIKKLFPDSHITWLVNSNLSSLIPIIEGVDDIILFNRSMWKKRKSFFSFISEVSLFIKTLRKTEFDAVLDVQGLFRSSLFSLLSRSQIKAGFDNAREFASFAYNKIIKVKNKKLHAVEQNKFILKALSDNIDDRVKFQFAVTNDIKLKVDEILKNKGVGADFCIFAPDARWVSKKWPLNYFIELSKLLIDSLQIDVVIVGDTFTQREWQNAQIDNRCHLLAGVTNLPELVELMSRASFSVTNDSGPMHIAVAVNTFVFALIGPTSPEKTGPYKNSHIIDSDISCSPCFKKICPITDVSSPGQCMQDITVSRVFELIINNKNEWLEKFYHEGKEEK